MEKYEQMWKGLNIDLEKHSALMNGLGQLFQETYLTQKNSPKNMEYFYNVIGEIHGARIEELIEIKKAGNPVVGTFCIFVPEEIIVAAGGACVGLCGGAQFSIEYAEEDLPRNICPLVKSAYGFKKSNTCPYIQVSDFIYGETTCETKKKTWEQLNKLHPTHVMHIPQMKRERDLNLWLLELKDFKSHLEKVTGKTITKENLIEGIKIINEKRNAMKRLEKIRMSDPIIISGKDSLLIEQISFYDDPVRFTQQLNSLCDELELRVNSGNTVFEKDTPKILVAGTPMAPPNWKLHHIIETSGGAVVNEESCIGNRYYKDNIEYSDSMTEEKLLTEMIKRYSKVDCACFTPNDERNDKIINLVKDTKAKGVIYYSLSFCHTYNIEYKKIADVCKQNNIPIMKIESDYSPEDEGQIKTRVEAFIEQIEQ